METLDAIKKEAEGEAAGGIAAAGGAAASPGAPVPAIADAAALDRAEVEGWAELPRQVGAILCMALPELAEHYSDRACTAWGESMHRVAKKYGWSSAMIGPELGLALASVPLVIPTVMAIKIRRARAAPAVGDRSIVTARSAGTVPDPGDIAASGDASSRPAKVAPIG